MASYDENITQLEDLLYKIDIKGECSFQGQRIRGKNKIQLKYKWSEPIWPLSVQI
jgi:hypothetical protein